MASNTRAVIMQQPLDHLTQRLEQITQQLKALELIFAQFCEQHSAAANSTYQTYRKAGSGIISSSPESLS